MRENGCMYDSQRACHCFEDALAVRIPREMCMPIKCAIHKLGAYDFPSTFFSKIQIYAIILSALLGYANRSVFVS